MKSLAFLLLLTTLAFGQEFPKIVTKNDTFKLSVSSIKNTEATIYVDADSNVFMSVYKIAYKDFKTYRNPGKDAFIVQSGKTSYQLRHLTPKYDSTFKYSYSSFNEVLQFSAHRQKWDQLERQVSDSIITHKTNVIVVSGVIYNNKTKKYYPSTTVKIPESFYKIMIFNEDEIYTWIILNEEGGELSKALTGAQKMHIIIDEAKDSGNDLNLIIKK